MININAFAYMAKIIDDTPTRDRRLSPFINITNVE
jgi:hypothetical protein